MNKNFAKDLFQLQTELIDTKVDMVVSKSIDRVLQKIDNLQTEMHDMNHRFQSEIHGLRHDMHSGFAKLDTRVVAIETKLGIIGNKKKGFYDGMMDYLFKAGYSVLTFVSLYFAYLLIQMNFH